MTTTPSLFVLISTGEAQWRQHSLSFYIRESNFRFIQYPKEYSALMMEALKSHFSESTAMNLRMYMHTFNEFSLSQQIR